MKVFLALSNNGAPGVYPAGIFSSHELATQRFPPSEGMEIEEWEVDVVPIDEDEVAEGFDAEAR